MRIYDNGVYRDITEEELRHTETSDAPKIQIENLKKNLADTDYKAIKFAEGLIREEDYAPTKKQRQEWRNQINLLELEL